jgi:repressor LexA
MTGAGITRKTILNFIRDFKEREGYAPTVREIAANCSIKSPSVVQYHLNSLERQGMISRGKEKFRSISVVQEAEEGTLLPLLGSIAAGLPIPVPTTETIDSAARIAVPPDITRDRKNLYALRVTGNSMVDAMIADGDIVVMEQVYEVRNGDVVAVWLKNEQEVTLKKIYYEHGAVRLQPCNPHMTPIYQGVENVEVQGRVVAVIRINP